jgi:hypothetical protein
MAASDIVPGDVMTPDVMVPAEDLSQEEHGQQQEHAERRDAAIDEHGWEDATSSGRSLSNLSVTFPRRAGAELTTFPESVAARLTPDCNLTRCPKGPSNARM